MSIIASDRAERLAVKRSVVSIVMGGVLIATQGQRMDDGGGGAISWIITGAITAIFLAWASGIFRDTALREILNDESSDANRRRSLMIAFWNMIAAAIVCYGLTYFKNFGPRDAIQIIVTIGMSSALMSFGFSERISARA